MLHRFSGKIIHIDFGDCFEVAMTREKFPEKIPFRLTRMLINAMEVRRNFVRVSCAKHKPVFVCQWWISYSLQPCTLENTKWADLIRVLYLHQVTGLDGNYKKTCMKVMEVLRDNKDSLMAVLEAFVYDPLLNWRLIEKGAPVFKRHRHFVPAVSHDVLVWLLLDC